MGFTRSAQRDQVYRPGLVSRPQDSVPELARELGRVPELGREPEQVLERAQALAREQEQEPARAWVSEQAQEPVRVPVRAREPEQVPEQAQALVREQAQEPARAAQRHLPGLLRLPQRWGYLRWPRYPRTPR